MSRRPSWTVVLTPDGYAAVPIHALLDRAERLHKQHAIDKAVKLNADLNDRDVARRFGGEVAA